MWQLENLFGYINPDQMLPVATTATTFVGAILMFGRRSFELLARSVGLRAKDSGIARNGSAQNAGPGFPPAACGLAKPGG